MSKKQADVLVPSAVITINYYETHIDVDIKGFEALNARKIEKGMAQAIREQQRLRQIQLAEHRRNRINGTEAAHAAE